MKKLFAVAILFVTSACLGPGIGGSTLTSEITRPGLVVEGGSVPAISFYVRDGSQRGTIRATNPDILKDRVPVSDRNLFVTDEFDIWDEDSVLAWVEANFEGNYVIRGPKRCGIREDPDAKALGLSCRRDDGLPGTFGESADFNEW